MVGDFLMWNASCPSQFPVRWSNLLGHWVGELERSEQEGGVSPAFSRAPKGYSSEWGTGRGIQPSTQEIPQPFAHSAREFYVLI